MIVEMTAQRHSARSTGTTSPRTSPSPRTLADDLAARSNDQLTELLLTRPDLATPPPAGTSVLAQRALAAASINLAGESLTLLSAAVLESVIVLSNTSDTMPGAGSTSAKAVVRLLSGRATKAAIDAAIDDLRERAVVWGTKTQLCVGAHAGAALPTRSMYLTGPLASIDIADISQRLENIGERERELLATLSTGSPLGRTRDAEPDADPAKPVPHLLAANLLARVDEQTVELPPVVGSLLRGESAIGIADLNEPALQPDPSAPALGSAATRRKNIEATAGGEALELLRHATDTVHTLAAAPAAVLRSGSLGIRELRRIAKSTGIDTDRLSFVVELLGSARLLDSGFPDPPTSSGEPVWAPTTAMDIWLHQPPAQRWLALASAWWAMPRRPWQVGENSTDGSPMASLSGELHDVSAVLERRMIVDALAMAAPGESVDIDSLAPLLTWRHPRWQRRLHRQLVAATLDEARALGLVAHGSLTRVGRAMVTPPSDGEWDTNVRDAMLAALPEPIDYFLTQADLTVTVPGPLDAELASVLTITAKLESGGAASVYRVTEDSVRRALDTGRTGTELLTFFTNHSRTPVPQSLEYLIADVARRHGQLRVGLASSFIRCEDSTTLAAVLAAPVAESLALRALAPTVAVSQAPLRQVLDDLRSAGFAPAGEDSSGDLVDMRDTGIRVPAQRKPRSAPTRRQGTPTATAVASVVDRMRSHDAANSAVPHGSAQSAGGGEAATALLQLAIRSGQPVRIGYVDAHGSASRHVITAQAIGAGQLVATDDRYSLHRITSVELLAE